MKNLKEYINENKKEYPILSFLNKYEFKFDKINFGAYYFNFNDFKNHPEIRKLLIISRTGGTSYYMHDLAKNVQKNVLHDKIDINILPLILSLGRKKYEGVEIKFKNNDKLLCEIDLTDINKSILLQIKKDPYDKTYEDLYIDSLEYLIKEVKKYIMN